MKLMINKILKFATYFLSSSVFVFILGFYVAKDQDKYIEHSPTYRILIVATVITVLIYNELDRKDNNDGK